MASATAELEAAIAALPAKKQRLRDSFDRLVASAPIPIPFNWDVLDAHISSLQTSIDVRFRQLQGSRHAALTTTDPVEHQGKEDQESHVEHPVRDQGQDSNEEEGERTNSAPSDLNDEEEQEREEEPIEVYLDQVYEVEGEANKASPGPEDDEEETIDASPGLGLKEENENAKEAMEAPPASRSNGVMKEKEWRCPIIPDFAGGGGAAEAAVRRDIVAASASMDTSTMAEILCWGNKRCLRARRHFLPALWGSPEPHAFVVGAIRDFLARAEPKGDKHWENCSWLLCCVRKLTAEPSVGTLEQANRLAEDWKEMIGKPESCKDLGRLAIYGLFRFLVSYNIALEFDAREIIHHVGNIPRHRKQNCIELCNRLGLIHKMTDSINHLIENGQEPDALRLACVLNLTDKYPPLYIMNEYVDKAKKTAQEIISKENDSPESLNQAMTKQVNALISSWRAVDEYNIDSAHRTSIKAEITQLLHEYAHKRQSLPEACLSALSPHKQHNLQEQCEQHLQTFEEEQHQKLQEKQHQRTQDLQPKPDEEHHYQQKEQEVRKQEGSQQRFGEKRYNKKRKRNYHKQQQQQQQQRAQEMRQHRYHKQPRLSHFHADSFGHPPHNARLGNHDSQQFSGIRGAPPRYPGPYNHPQLCTARKSAIQARVAAAHDLTDRLN